MRAIKPICTSIYGSDFDLIGSYTMPMGNIAALMAILQLSRPTLYFSRANAEASSTSLPGSAVSVTYRNACRELPVSFAENISNTFAPLLLYKVRSNISGRDRRHFPEQVTIEVTSASLVETRVYVPAVRSVRWLGEHMLMLQAGSVHLYLGYILLTLVILMLVGILFDATPQISTTRPLHNALTVRHRRSNPQNRGKDAKSHRGFHPSASL